MATEEVGDYKYVTRGVAKTLKELLRIRSQGYFADDVDAFEAFLEEHLELMNTYRDTRFPVGDPNEDRLNNRDMLLSDD
ncbi:MAG: hypothetical protein U5K37_12830 [Natrialbaceae archaeon]|nr:hypothetical protein [Natrialbaceae archaeon]